MDKNSIKIKYPKLFKLLRNIYLFFHPGVAVEEFFSGEVSSYEGFWIMQKNGSGWSKVPLNPNI